MTTIAESIAARLRRARSDAGLSLRNLAAAITAAGHPVSHYAVHQYERGASQAPAGYLHAFCVVLAVSPGWLLFGTASAGDAPQRAAAPAGSVPAALERWQRLASCCPAAHPLRARLDALVVQERPPRPAAAVSRRELARRRLRREGLVASSAPHLAFLLRIAESDRAVAFVACTDAVVLASAGTETAREEASLAPGRLREGTTDARGFVREAVELGNTLVVLRPSFPEELARLATPIRSAAGECFGALGLALPTGVARPAHLASVLHAADCIERSLPAA